MKETENIKTYEYESDFGTYQLHPWISTYANNGNLAMGFDHFDEEYQCWDSFCYATVNVIPLGYLQSCIDTNDNGMKFLDFLEKNGFGQRMDIAIPSGWCMYPVFRFNEDRLKEINPEAFAEYQKGYGKDKQPLAEKISKAEAKEEKAEKGSQNKEPER